MFHEHCLGHARGPGREQHISRVTRRRRAAQALRIFLREELIEAIQAMAERFVRRKPCEKAALS